MGREPRWTDEQFIAAVREAASVAGTCRVLGLVPIGGNYRTVHEAVRRLALDTSHWTGAAWNRGQRGRLSNTRRPLDELLR